MYNHKKQTGFTLIEVLVSSTLFILVLLAVTATYTVGQRIYTQSTANNELWQNARSALDRMSREIRQTSEIVTTLPPTSTDPDNPPAQELIFKNGHNTSAVSYIRYYLIGTNIYREYYAYSFPSDPSTYVLWDSIDQFGNSPDKVVLSDEMIGEFFTTLAFWSSNDVINIAISLTKKDQNINLFTAVFGRNL